MITITGYTGTNPVVLQSSTNLVSWLPVLTNTASTNTLNMLDPNAENKARFYRVALQ
jgi:hypothetical protein